MQKEAWKYSMIAILLSALGILIRWLQCQIIFDPETGLPTPHAVISAVVVVLLILIPAVLWFASGRLPKNASPEEPEEALAEPNREVGLLLAVFGCIALLGAILLFFTAGSTFLRITALLGILAAPAMALLLHLPRWGGFGAFLSVTPVVFFCVWLVCLYKENAVDPVVWAYGVQVLAIAACLLAGFRLCGYLFYRQNARKAVFACALAMAYCLTVLMDDTSTAARILFAGWGVGYGVMSWVLVRNFVPPTEEESSY